MFMFEPNSFKGSEQRKQKKKTKQNKKKKNKKKKKKYLSTSQRSTGQEPCPSYLGFKLSKR